MATLAKVAEQGEYLYYQGYASDEDFFSTDDFKRNVAIYYSKALNELYQAARRESKQETGFNTGDISPQWLIGEDTTPTDIKYDEDRDIWYIETSYPIFAFNFDSFTNGLNGVYPLKKGVNLKKLNINEVTFLNQLPTTSDIYYWVEGTKRILLSKNPGCKLTKRYIPAVVDSDDQCVMADTIMAEVIEKVLTLMFGAKNGNVIDKTADKNSNEIMPGEINPEAKKQ